MDWKEEGKRMGYSDSRTLRQKALAALRGNWQTALLVTFVAGLLSLIINALQVRLDAIDTYTFSSQLETGDWAGVWRAASNEVGSHWYITLLGIVSALVSPALSLGMIHYFLTLHREHEAGSKLVFSRMNIFWRAFGQSFMVGLFIALWTLAALIPVLFLLYTIRPVAWIVAFVLLLCAMIPALIAALRYAMAPYLMADDPGVRVMKSIRRSKEMMDGHKGRLILLMLSFLGWYLLLVIVIGILNELLHTVGTGLGMLLSLVVQVYVQSAVTAFYLELKGDAPKEDVQAQGNVA
jgi:uncharacterized membrane protein